MVVKTREFVQQSDLGYLAFFLGLRVNELVMQRTAKAGFKEVRESHGFVIQHLIESERTITELARRMEVTQQAASKIVAELIRLRVVEAVSAKDRRAKRISLTRRVGGASRSADAQGPRLTTGCFVLPACGATKKRSRSYSLGWRHWVASRKSRRGEFARLGKRQFCAYPCRPFLRIRPCTQLVGN
jgi:DNA-binding MarR family transcriptional regulator